MLRLPAEWRAARRVVLVASALFLLVVSRWQPWTLFHDAGFSNDFYDEQARAFWHLRLDVPSDVAGPEGFLIDGRTYLYYGPFLALLRMPFVLLGQWVDGRLVRVSMLAAYVLSCVGALRLLQSVARRMVTTVSDRRATWFVALVAAGPILSAAGWDSVYHETELWALALFLLTLAAALDLAAQPSRRGAVTCGLLTVATVLTRASIGYGAVAVMGLVAVVVFTRHRRRRLAAAIVAWPIGALALSLALNLAKFGTLLDLPADRQVLTLQSPARAEWFAGNGGSFFSVRFLPTTVVQYLRPDALGIDRLVPFVRFGPLATEYGSYPLEGNTPSSSLPVAATGLVILALLGAGIIARRRLLWMLPALAGAAIAAVPTLLIGFVAHRYLIDLLPVVILPAAVAATGLAVPRVRRASAVALPLAITLAWSVVANVGFATWISELKNPTFTRVRYAIDDAVFDGPPPAVIRLDAGAPVPRDGVVAIDDRCAGLYIAEQGAWVPLERADGRRTLDLRARLAGADLVLSTGQGTLVVHRDGTQVTGRWLPESGTAVEGSLTVATDVTAVSVVSDPVAGGLRITADGMFLLAASAAPDLGTAVVEGDAEVVTRADSTELCTRLDRRLTDDR